MSNLQLGKSAQEEEQKVPGSSQAYIESEAEEVTPIAMKSRRAASK